MGGVKVDYGKRAHRGIRSDAIANTLPHSVALSFSSMSPDWRTVMSKTLNCKSEERHTTGGGVDSAVASFEGTASVSLSFTGSDSDGVEADSGDVASVVSTALAAFGISASYSALMRTVEGEAWVRYKSHQRGKNGCAQQLCLWTPRLPLWR